MCLLRWLRTLFSRDLPIKEALCAWDYLLADIDYNFIEYPQVDSTTREYLPNIDFFSISMLQSMRDDLIIASENEAEILFLSTVCNRVSVA